MPPHTAWLGDDAKFAQSSKLFGSKYSGQAGFASVYRRRPFTPLRIGSKDEGV
jgi:hypothetical protein